MDEATGRATPEATSTAGVRATVAGGGVLGRPVATEVGAGPPGRTSRTRAGSPAPDDATEDRTNPSPGPVDGLSRVAAVGRTGADLTWFRDVDAEARDLDAEARDVDAEARDLDAGSRDVDGRKVFALDGGNGDSQNAVGPQPRQTPGTGRDEYP